MACVRPMLRVEEENGKVRIYSMSEEDKREYSSWLADHANTFDRMSKKVQKIPCGKCVGCRLDYSRNWANRLMLEKTLHKESWFVSLTFDDEHIINCLTDKGSLSIRKRHVQLFMKRLREKVYPNKIRFFGVGEYGELYARPHYHLIVFGLHLPIQGLKFLKKNEFGANMFSSDLIKEVWSDPVTHESYGFNVCEDVCWENCAYVARYVMKKYKGPEAKIYSEYGLEPPFVLMSRRPGIGFGYMENNPDWVNKNMFIIGTEDGVRQIPVPKYFERYLEKNDPDLAEARREIKREIMRNQDFNIMKSTDKTRSEYAKILENNLLTAQRVLTNFRKSV